MSPRQVFPYDEYGGSLRSSQQFKVGNGDIILAQSQQQQQQQQQEEEGAEVSRSRKNENPLAPLPLSCEHSRDLHDALNDDDDDDDDLDGDLHSVDLDSHWAGRDHVPKRGVEIFVGGLTRSTRRDMLRDWFQHAGEVTEVRIARDKRRRRCRGYGYVRFATSEQANRAIDTMHHFEFKHGRFLGVLPSDENRTLFVGGLLEEWSCEYFCQLLKEKMPGLRKVEPIPDRENRFKVRTFCFLEFATHAEAAVIFDRHHTSPRPPPPPPRPPPTQQTAAANASPPSAPTPRLSLDLPGSSSTCASASGLSATTVATGGGSSSADAGGFFFDSDTRLGSNSTSCANGMCCEAGGRGDGSALGSAATTTTANTSASPDISGDGGSGGLRFDGGGVWRQQYLALEDSRGGGSGSDCSRSDVAAATTTARTAEYATNSGDESGDGSGNAVGDGHEAGARTGGAIPLVVGGATLKVDWADPLRYHIHLNGGIKGPSAPSEFGTPDGRPASRGGGGSGSGSGSGNGGGRNGYASGGSGVRGGGGFGVGSTWQQQPQQQGHQQQQQRLHRHRSALLPAPHWQDVDHVARMTQRGLQQQQQLQRRQQLHHREHNQREHQQRQFLDVARDYHPSHLTFNGGASRLPARERGYTIAAGYTTSRRSPFDGGGGGVAGGELALPRSPLQHAGYDDERPRSKSSSYFHTSHHHHQQHSGGSPSQASMFRSVAAAATDSQDYGEVRFSAPSPHLNNLRYHQARASPGPARGGGRGPDESHGMHDNPGSTGVLAGFQNFGPSDMAGLSALTRGDRPDRSSVGHDSGRHHHHHHHHHSPLSGSTAAAAAGLAAPAGGLATTRLYTAGPGMSDGHMGAREAFSAAAKSAGAGGAAGDVTHAPVSRSTTCRPLVERPQPEGPGDGRRRATAALPSSAWKHRHLSGNERPVSAGLTSALSYEAASNSAVPLSREVRERPVSSASLQGGYQSMYDGQRPLQHQRWEQQGAEDLTQDVSSKATTKTGSDKGRHSGLGSSSNGYHAAAFDSRFEQRQQQRQQRAPEQFSHAVPAAASAHPVAHRRTFSDGLDIDFGIGSYGASHTPPGFSDVRVFGSSSAAAAANGTWTAAGSGGIVSVAEEENQQQRAQQEEILNTDMPAYRHQGRGGGGGTGIGSGGADGGSGNISSGNTWEAATPSFSPPTVEEDSAGGMNLGAGLWENIGAGSLSFTEHLSWPSGPDSLDDGGGAADGDNSWGP